MEIRVIDFEILTRSFQPYVDGYFKIEDEKKTMLKSIESEKNEFEDIIKRAQSGLLMDPSSQERDSKRVRELQEILMQKDTEFKTRIKTMTEELNTDIYEQLETIVSEWASSNEIDLVMGKMEVIFNTDKIDVTDSIIEVIKEKNLFFDESKQGAMAEDGPQIYG